MNQRYEIIDQNIFTNFNSLIKKNKFDIVFLDPPYKEKKVPSIIDNITNEKLLKNKGIIIIHRHKNDDENYSNNFKILETKKYGISKILFGILD